MLGEDNPTRKTWLRTFAILSSCVSIPLLAFLLVQITEPKAILSDALTLKLEIKSEDGRPVVTHELPAEQQRILQKQLRALEEVESFLPLVGHLRVPVTLTLNIRNPYVYRISSEAIEIGWRIFESKGQLARAYMKVWVLQNLPSEFSSSLLLQDVVADFLMVSMQGTFHVESPITTQTLAVDRVLPWPASVHSQSGLCRSGWYPGELTAFCAAVLRDAQGILSGQKVIAQGLRPIMAAVLAKTYGEMSPMDKVRFVQLWAMNLRDPSVELWELRRSDHESLSLRQSRDFVSRVAHALVLFPGHERRFSQLKIYLDRALIESGLDKEAKIDLLMRLERTPEKVAESLVKLQDLIQGDNPVTVLIVTDEESFILNTEVQVRQEEFALLRPVKSVWETCRQTTAGQIAATGVLGPRVLFTANCQTVPSYRSYIRYGVEAFARDNLDVSFAILHLPSLSLAIKRGFSNASRLRDFLEPRGLRTLEKNKEALGLGEFVRHEKTRAYRVRGAVEAIEWLRTSEEN